VVEAEVTGGLEHPFIVPVYGLGTYADGRPFYAMRFIKGDSLKEAVERFHAPEASGGGGREGGVRAGAGTAATPPARDSAWSVLLIFLRLGCTCFGGPIAHLGYDMHSWSELSPPSSASSGGYAS